MHAVALVITLHLLGSFAVLVVLRGRFVAFSICSGLLWGLALHAFLSLVPVLALFALQRPPLYRGSAMLTICALGAALLALRLFRGLRSGGRSIRRIAWVQAFAVATLAGCTAASQAWNFSALSVDSFAYIEHGLALARITDPRFATLGFLEGWSFFGVLLHATTDLAGVEYLYFLFPVVSVSFLSTLSAASWTAVRALGRSKRTAAVAVGLGTLSLVSCYFVAFEMFYIHVNWLASMYVLLFFFSAWMALQREDDRWFVLAAAAAFTFALARVEGPMFLVLFLCLLALERRPRPAPSWPASALALPAALWCAGLILLVGDGGRVLAPSRLAFMIAGLLASVVLARAMRHEGFAERAHWFQRAGLMLLVLTFAGMTLDRPDHMLKQSLIHLANAFRIGNWGSGWALAGGLALASPALGRVPHFRFVVFGVVGYLLVTFDLAYFGFWRSGWFDSGNRMLTHVLPTIVWLLSLKAATIVPCPPRRDPGPSEHR